jgi:hypothetical protein
MDEFEAFMRDRHMSEEKLMRYTMSFMVKGTAIWWVEHHSAAVPFPFLT